MKCRRAYRYICEHLDADINSRKCRAIKKHLGGCPDCAAYLDSLKKTIFLYKHAPVPPLSRTVHKRLVKVIDIAVLEPKTKRHRSRKGTQPAR
ncbi:MAG: hypothetical protein C4326_14355 [Ignavibacteria bacterium]